MFNAADGCLLSVFLKVFLAFWELTYIPWKSNIEDDFPFPKVGYVSSLEDSQADFLHQGCFFSQKHPAPHEVSQSLALKSKCNVTGFFFRFFWCTEGLSLGLLFEWLRGFRMVWVMFCGNVCPHCRVHLFLFSSNWRFTNVAVNMLPLRRFIQLLLRLEDVQTIGTWMFKIVRHFLSCT